jgi:hypothetical protein
MTNEKRGCISMQKMAEFQAHKDIVTGEKSLGEDPV